MKPEELEKMPLQVEKLFFDLQNRVMEDVVRRIKKTKEITSTADYQIDKMIIMGQNSEFIEAEIKRLTEMTDSEIYQLYEDVIDKEYTRNKSIYEQVNAEFIPYEESPEMKAWVSAVTAQTKGEIKNITQSMGFALNYNGKTVFTPFSEYYQKYLDRASLDIITGVFSYDTVLRRVVKEMTFSGIRSVDYASGHSNRITAAGRRAVMTGVNQLCSQINLMNAEKLGTDTFEITFHYGARPSHWWGGMVFTKSELESVCGLGKVDGLCGANCRHNFMAFIKDVSVRTYTDEQLAEMNTRDKVEREWQGKKYNAYEASQKQRQMETLMRKQRSDVKLLKAGKADQEEIIAAQARYVNTLHQYQAFSKKMKLPEQMERVYMDGLGRIAPKQFAMQLKDSTDMWSSGVKRDLKIDEKTLSKRIKETAVVYDKNGKYLFTKRGNERSVNFTKSEVKRMKNGVVTHNHPSGASFSVADWLLFKKAQLSEVRAIGEDGTYYLRRSESDSLSSVDNDDFEIELRELRKKIKNKYNKLYENGIIDKQEQLLQSTDEYNRLFAKRFGVEYGKEKFYE